MNKKVYVLLAEGFELIEALAPVDILRRGGIEVLTVSINENKNVTSAQKVDVVADLLLSDANLEDGGVLVLPGGYPGYVNLSNSEKVEKILKQYVSEEKYVAAICGAPTILSKYGLFKGKKITAHSSVAEELKDYIYTANIVERDNNLITGIGAGRALEFGFEIAKVLLNDEKVENIKKGMELI